jgi:monoamine oxidase
MARTPLMQMLACVAGQGTPAADQPSAIGRRMLLGAGAGAAVTALVPVTGLGATARIAVVGAGLAGLTAAYRLHNAGYSADVFEASSRLGGRCYTARDVFAEGQIAEHGGEFIDTGHKEIRALAAELGLMLDDVLAATPPQTHPLFVVNGKPYSLADATRDWQPLYPVLQAQSASLGDYSYRASTEAARRFDAMTISGWVAAYVPGGRAGSLGQLIESAFAEENAADADQQSALNVIPVLAVDPRQDFNLYTTESDQRFHVRGGNDQIPTRLGERLGVPVRTAMPLVAIARLANGRVRLSFKRDTGTVDADYDRVILALPFSVLATAVDYRGAGFGPLKVRAITTLPMGKSVKFQMQFTRRAWTGVGCTGEIRVPSAVFQTTWEVTRSQAGQAGILNFFSGGTRAVHVGATDAAALAAEVLRDAAPLLPGLEWNGRVTKDAWAQNPWSLGSYSYFPPGYQTTTAGIERQPEGHCFFAGEHTSSENGYMNGGVESGMRAARQVIASLRR